MLAFSGSLLVIVSVLGGYSAMGGALSTLWQPYEIMVIVGAAIGAFIVANPKHVLLETAHGLREMIYSVRYGRAEYIELLSMLFVVFRMARMKGWLPMEKHIEHPSTSDLFDKFPSFYDNDHALTFFCDYLRIISLGSTNPYEISALMDEEIETIHLERLQVANALQTMAESMPALGIVAAVLGVIRAMGSISEPPAILGHLIGGALVGTFTGIWLSYGFIGPLASAMQSRVDAEMKYYLSMKAGLLAFLQGSAPQMAIEFARKVLLAENRPTFQEVEDATLSIPAK